MPSLFSYLQTKVDETQRPQQYILTGSQQFLLNQHISQSLAGRTAILRLLPFNLSELVAQPFVSLDKILPQQNTRSPCDLKTLLLQGMYPRVHEFNLTPYQFYKDYTETYLIRDLQSLTQVGDLLLFRKFLRILAGRSGQVVNFSQIGSDVGVAHNTIHRWISLLETCYLIHLIPPFYNNHNKRLVKSPKLYFLDTGLLCYLLGIENTEQLQTHPLIGSIFETYVFSELLKMRTHQGQEAKIYYWRDQSGLEIDFICEWNNQIMPIEVKLAQTFSHDQIRPMLKWLQLNPTNDLKRFLIYGGESFQLRQSIQVIPWFIV